MSDDPTYLSMYGLTNPWTVWILQQDTAIVANHSADVVRLQMLAPVCKAHDTPKRMLYRPGAWKCYAHDDPISVLIEPRIERAPVLDVISRLDEVLDYQWDPKEVRWVVRSIML